jgi:hypothetical protein
MKGQSGSMMGRNFITWRAMPGAKPEGRQRRGGQPEPWGRRCNAFVAGSCRGLRATKIASRSACRVHSQPLPQRQQTARAGLRASERPSQLATPSPQHASRQPPLHLLAEREGEEEACLGAESSSGAASPGLLQSPAADLAWDGSGASSSGRPAAAGRASRRDRRGWALSCCCCCLPVQLTSSTLLRVLRDPASVRENAGALHE